MILTVTPNPAIDKTVQIEGFRAGGTFSVDSTTTTCAGKGVNVSRTLAALGARSVCTGLLGGSHLDSFNSQMHAAGVVPAFALSAGRVRVNTTVMDPGSEGETHIRERGEEVTAEEIDALCDNVSQHAESGEWVVGCGSLPPGMSSAAWGHILSRARGHGARIAIDSSGEGLEVVRSLKPDLIKPNAIELADLCGCPIGSPEDAIKAARVLAGELPSTLLVTLGADGALLVNAEVELAARCSPRRVLSTVGAGDAALAGFLWAESRGDDAEGCLRAAVAAGATRVSEPVAGRFEATEFERLLEEVKVVPLQ